MTESVLWFEEVGKDDVESVGGKGASLGEMAGNDFPVPGGFVVTAQAYRRLLRDTGIENDLEEALDVDVEDSEALERAHDRAVELVENAGMPDDLRAEIEDAYSELGDDAFVAVRSSATAEDLPSVAADESTLLKVDGEPVFGRMKEIAPLDCGRHTVEVPSLTDDGVAWREVERIYEHHTEEDSLYRVTTETGRQITVTPDHSLVVLNEDTLEPETTTIDEIDGDEKVPVVRKLAPMEADSETIDVTEYVRGGEVIRTDGGVIIDNDSTNQKIQQSLPDTIRADEDFAYFLGVYVAEGSTYGSNEVCITNTDEDVLGRVVDLMDRLGLWNGQNKNKHSYRFHCKSLVRFLHAVAGEPADTSGKGRLARQKRVPEFVFGWDKERIGQFLRGCFDGDGTVNDEIGYATTSDRLTEGIARLLELIGIDYRIRERDVREGWSDSYRIMIPAREAESFRETVGFESEEKSKSLDELVESRAQKEYYPEFKRTITVDDALAERVRDRFEDTLPTEEVTVALCPDCGDETNKSSPYDGRERWYCSDCGAAFYEEDVTFVTEKRYSGRDDGGRFESDGIPWNKGRISGTYSQKTFNKIVGELGVESLKFDDTVGWEGIESVEQVEYNGPVYDFCVPGAENFAAGRGSVVTHNTASFAGQQDTYLNVQGADELVERVKDCWASLFTERAIYYRVEKGFSHDDVNIAVVVQRMVDAEKSGVAFSSDPSTGDARVTVEAAWGLGEAVVSGGVTPDNYVFDRERREVVKSNVASKKVMHVKDASTGETVEREVPDDRREERVLTEDEIEEIAEVAERLEEHYGAPQDIEWAIQDGEFYVLQSRPITTIADESAGEEGSDGNDGEVAVEGLGASPGKESGTVRIVRKLDEIDRIEDGDVLVTEQTTPDMVPAMKRSAAIVTDEGGLTSHAAIVSRELGKTAVVGTGDATKALEDGDSVTVDGGKGKVTRGKPDEAEPEPPEPANGTAPPPAEPQPVTATDVKVNVSIPDAAEAAAETGADGVGLLRMEHMVLNLGKTPAKYVGDHGERAYIDEIVEDVQGVAEEFYPRPVRVRTLDAPTDEFRNLEGGDDEPVEGNPMMGYRGIRRALEEPDIFELELRAFRKLYDLGYDNIEIMFPLVVDADETAEARELMERAGLDTDDINWGVMIETPASAMVVEEIADEGVDFVSFGTNDLTQYTLAADRNNENVSEIYNETHPGVLALMSRVIQVCGDRDVRTSICGQAGSNPEMVEFLVEEGITSVSANIDAVGDMRRRVARVEKRLMLDHARGTDAGERY